MLVRLRKNNRTNYSLTQNQSFIIRIRHDIRKAISPFNRTLDAWMQLCNAHCDIRQSDRDSHEIPEEQNALSIFSKKKKRKIKRQLLLQHTSVVRAHRKCLSFFQRNYSERAKNGRKNVIITSWDFNLALFASLHNNFQFSFLSFVLTLVDVFQSTNGEFDAIWSRQVIQIIPFDAIKIKQYISYSHQSPQVSWWNREKYHKKSCYRWAIAVIVGC